jgi:hypothetical protein
MWRVNIVNTTVLSLVSRHTVHICTLLLQCTDVMCTTVECDSDRYCHVCPRPLLSRISATAIVTCTCDRYCHVYLRPLLSRVPATALYVFLRLLHRVQVPPDTEHVHLRPPRNGYFLPLRTCSIGHDSTCTFSQYTHVQYCKYQ